ncbi:MAG TPA: chloride channel protein [Acidimicrobiales bacterium]|nr:chloride channel protein [Acidimicrobiales bacterium]
MSETSSGAERGVPRWFRRRAPRVRQPAPLIPWRVPSGRGATEQPNAAGDPVPLTARFWSAVVLSGIATGLLGAFMMFVLFSVEHLAYGHSSASFEYAVEHSADLRRVLAMVVAGAVGGVAWYLLRRFTAGERSDIDDAVWNGTGELSFRRSLGTSLISEVVIGLGASIGRENAPKLMGGAAASWLSRPLGLSAAQRRLLVACSAGAGLACVYNVPLGGALFTAELLVGSISLPVMSPALLCSAVATATAWLYLPQQATYVGIPGYHFSMTLMVFAVVAGPVVGLVSVAWVRLIGFVSHHRPRGRAALVVPLFAFTAVGLMGIAYPQLFGNGKDMAHDAFVGLGSIGLFGALFALKPVATGLCLGSGANGGLFTPTLSTGAMLGGFLGAAWSMMCGGSPVGAFAMVGAAAMIGASMQAPLAAMALVLELTHSGISVLVPMMTATAGATALARYVDGYSIYSARLPAEASY